MLAVHDYPPDAAPEAIDLVLRQMETFAEEWTPMTAVELTETGATTAERGRRSYRTAFEIKLDLPEAAGQVRGQLRSWLRDKGYDVEQFDARRTTIGPGVTLFYVSINSATGWQLRERRDQLTWVSTVAVSGGEGSPDTSWVSLSVEPIGPDCATVTPAPPKLVKLLLEAFEAYDGEAQLSAHPTPTAEQRVEDLLDVVCSPNRRLPVVVAAPPVDASFGHWQQVVADITRDLPGLASVYTLQPAAVELFNDGIGSTHGIGPGAIRTYLSDVDPAVPEDAVRHRVLGRRRIETEPGRARRALAALPRRLAASSLPAQAARGLNLSLRDFARDRSAPALPAQRPPQEEEVAILNDLLETADDNERQLKKHVASLEEQVLDLAAELEVARDDIASRDDHIRALRQLVPSDRRAESFTPVEERTELPKSFSDLLARMDELAPFVVFTGDRDTCLDLDDQPQNSTWAQTAWQGLLALRDYAAATRHGSFHGDFQTWCQEPAGEGRGFAPGKVATGESETVRGNKRLAGMRTLPVPVEVDQAGAVFMGAHLRLGRSGTVSPRLHFHDASASHARIYVGYIGRHLENTKTS